MQYNPIKSKKRYEKIMDQIISMIKTQQLHPGEKIDSIEKLSKQFQVSTSVIREALSGLKAIGLVNIQQGEGTFINNFNATSISLPITTALLRKREDIQELFEVRKIMEVGAVRLAAHHHTQKDLINIEKALLLMNESDTFNEKADYNFHYQIVKASHNKMLINLLRSISDIMIETIRNAQKVILSSDVKEVKLQEEHELIFKALQEKQPEQAEYYMLKHLEGVERSLTPFLKN